MKSRSTALRLLPIAFALALGFSMTSATAQGTKVLKTELHSVKVSKVVDGLHHPWGMAFLPDGRILVTEKRGTLRVIDGGKLVAKPVEGMPKSTDHGQGGLMDVVLHPDYAKNGWIYWTFNGEENGQHGTELARGKLGGTQDAPRMTDVQVLFKLQPKGPTRHHFGSRIVFDKQNHLFVTFGDRGDSPGKGKDQRAQNLGDHAGKSIRLFDDGRVPPDNPFVKTAGAKPEIWTLGNRNMQGAALNPVTGILWTHEHGPQGGDEVNIMKPGVNYGWPVITYGVNYGIGTKIGEGAAKDGMAQPIHKWVPSIAPSGMAFYTGDKFPKWAGNLLVGALAGQTVARLKLDGDKVVGEERMFTGEFGRIRDLRQGPDGNVYLLIDSPDAPLLRLEPAA
jgi:aldose sugar dehydrogenase